MTTDIQKQIEKRPHLKDPFELYEKWQRFSLEAAALLPKARSEISAAEAKVYPKEVVDSIFTLFLSVFDLPGEELEPLRQALENGTIDFMRFPLDEVPDISSSFTEQEAATIVFLLSRPYFLALRGSFPLDGNQWQEGRCPLCSARATLASIVDGPKRLLHCSFCGTSGSYQFIGCPNCGSTDAAKFNTIMSEDEPGFRVITCDSCRTYIKVVESTVLKEMTFDLADLASIPLDIVTQEKGYARMTPNPIGLRRIG